VDHAPEPRGNGEGNDAAKKQVQINLNDEELQASIEKYDRMMEEMESSQSDVFGDFCKAKTGEERNAIRLKHFQTNTPFG